MVAEINDLGLVPAERFELFGTRYYRQEGLSGPSVTTVIKDSWGPDLSDWYARCAAKDTIKAVNEIQQPALMKDRTAWEREIVSDAAGAGLRTALQHAAVGELFHDFMWSGELDTEKAETLPPEFRKMLNTLMQTWPQILSKWDIFPTLTEFKLIGLTSDESVYGGTPDAVVEDPSGYISLLEVKTSRQLATSHAVQAAAYEHALRTRYGLRVNGTFVLRIDKYQPGKFDYWEVDLINSWRFFEDAMHKYTKESEVWVQARD